MAPPRRALIAVTSAHAPLYPDGKETGVFITEALHPFITLRKAGFEVDLVSETGYYEPDWLSLQKEWLPPTDRQIYLDHTSEFRKKLDNLLRPSDIDRQYGLLFFSAGHAAMIDYPDATGLQGIAANLYQDGGVVGAVCHGAAIFPGIVDESGKSIVWGKRVTGFTAKGEEEEGVLGTVREWPAIRGWESGTVEDVVKEAGATYVAPPGPWDAFTITDGRIVTGANPASAKVTAEACVKAFDALTEYHTGL